MCFTEKETFETQIEIQYHLTAKWFCCQFPLINHLAPIKAIKYGPLMHAEEMVKVKVGALECNPLEAREIIDIKELSD